MVVAPTKKTGAWRTFMRLAAASKRYWGWYVLLGITCGLSAAANVASTEGLKRLVDAAVGRNVHDLRIGFFYGLIAFGGGSILDFFKCWLTARLDQNSVMNMQLRLVTKAQRVSQSFMDKNQTGDIISRVMDNAGTAQSALNNTCIDVIQNVLRVVFLLGYLINLNWQLTLGTVVASLAIPASLIPLSHYQKRIWDEFWKTDGELSSIVQDGIQGSETVKAYGLASSILRRYKERYSYLMKRIIKAEGWSQSTNLTIWTLLIAGLFFVLGYGGSLVAKGLTTAGAVTAFLISFEQISFPINSIVQSWPNLQKALGAADRVFELLDAPEQTEGWGLTQLDTASAGPGSNPVVFEDVSFAYGEGDPVLKDVSFVAEPGVVTAIVGESGSGKSTILKLLTGTYIPTKGNIALGGTPLTTFSLDSWRQCIGYVSQDIALFSKTILENIGLGQPGAMPEEIRQAAEAANCTEFVSVIPNGYDAYVGEKGVMLSGGQRQRIAIARAILKKPSLLLLDEATSALDNESERVIQEALERFCQGRTTIVVAHRLSTIMNASKIVFLEAGRVAEEGTHDELMAMQGRYYRMFTAAYGVTDQADTNREGVMAV